MIPARISVVTLGARDVASLRDFYSGLGWEAVVGLDDFAAFRTSGLVFTLYALEKLADDARAEATPPGEGMRSNLAINVDSREQVDAVIAAAEQAGARIAKPPEDAEWGGRSGYFADPEDNYWEVAWVPPDSAMAQLLRDAAS